ncbi:hypothetical protein QBC38DRAFT_536577 [Podospora fimiseda]|uniref:Tyrosinase copper-binding domain-containing protein n=1 Tax=Podospora fimiseda TaxID=252190 RepID=A0AAN7GYN8_9PEZI|nr:hypothetical protein QBC38DRAFT_536577 [Podospora fimiseda]
MKTFWSALILPCLLAGVDADWTTKIKVVRNPAYKLDVVDILANATMAKVEAYLERKIAAGKNNGCTLDTVVVRQEWSDMTNEQRQEYVAAVTCLMKRPSKAPKSRFPGALNRFDDFVAYHMSHAAELHDTIHLFPAHKQFVWAYEQALRNECGYTGYQPYMNYDRYAQDPIHSPMFNGNASSMGGNGAPDPTYKGIAQSGRTPNIIASGGGGGCVTEGPFKDMVVSLGPTSMSPIRGITKNPKSDGTASNPRCLRRDVNRNAALGATAAHAYSLLTSNNNINGFYNQLLGTPPPKNDPYPWGIHTAGHYIHAHDPGADPATSPGDPVFYFHHGAVDRLWWIWQMQDPENRINAWVDFTGGGGHTGHGRKRQSKLDPWKTVIDLEWLTDKSIPLMEAHDQLGGAGGQFCYVYI